MLVDTHAHLNMPEYMDLTEVLERAAASGVSAIINVGFDLPSSKAAVRLSDSYEQLFSAVGIHPHDAGKIRDSDFEELKKLAENLKVVAVGESGLDFYRNLSPKEDQVDLFIRHIRLAQELDLPLIVHSRDAHEDTLRILHENNKGFLKGVMHCFSGDKRIAQLSLDLGFYISFAGPLTFKNAHEAREVAKFVPIDKMLIETDCPYLAPDPFRGQRNEPSYMVRTAAKLAEVRGFSLEDLSERLAQNAKSLFTKLTI